MATLLCCVRERLCSFPHSLFVLYRCGVLSLFVLIDFSVIMYVFELSFRFSSLYNVSASWWFVCVGHGCVCIRYRVFVSIRLFSISYCRFLILFVYVYVCFRCIFCVPPSMISACNMRLNILPPDERLFIKHELIFVHIIFDWQ